MISTKPASSIKTGGPPFKAIEPKLPIIILKTDVEMAICQAIFICLFNPRLESISITPVKMISNPVAAKYPVYS